MTNSIENEKIKIDSGESKFDKNVYEKNVLEAIIEDKAKETEERLTKEREMMKSGNFEIERDNLKLDTKREAGEIDGENEILNHFCLLVEEGNKSYKRIHHIIEEMIKNVKKNKYYEENKENIENKEFEEGKIRIIGDKDKITIITTNYTKDNIEWIPKYLDELNNMSADELKEEYKNILDGKKEYKGQTLKTQGAGLGFIDIIRKSNGGKFTYLINDTKNPEIKKIEISIYLPNKDSIKEAFAA